MPSFLVSGTEEGLWVYLLELFKWSEEKGDYSVMLHIGWKAYSKDQ